MATVSVEQHVDLDASCITAVRMLAVDCIQQANSGHPGAPLGLAPVAFTLWDRFHKHNPANPFWYDRDRFVLSAGHASALLYVLLHLTGYDISRDDLRSFRQWGSPCAGHPEYELQRGIETTTGPLGQGVGNAVGFALAEAHLAAQFNRPGLDIVNHWTYCLCGDGDLMEGVASEAASLAGHLGLGKLITLYDNNHISIEGSTSLAFTEDVGQRFEAYGWQVLEADGRQVEAVDAAIADARAQTERPSLIIAHTNIGYGSPVQDSPKAHGEPLSKEHYAATKEFYGWPGDEPFYCPQEVLTHMRLALERGAAAEDAWRKRFDDYQAEFPDLAARFQRSMRGELPQGWDADLPQFAAGEKPLATRESAAKALNHLAGILEGELIGGSADLAPSTKTLIAGSPPVHKQAFGGANLHFGVREHGMGSICNGLALHGGVRPYCATFLVFSDYMRPAIRLAALMGAPVIYVFTHDSIGLGEDGPTHQPIEHLAALRSIPRLVVLRPGDANEAVWAWQIAVSRATGPVALVLTRQAASTIDRADLAGAENIKYGAYVLADPKEGAPEIVLMASGSELSLALGAFEKLRGLGIRGRVVSFPSWELFEEQPQSYRDAVLPPQITARVAIEAGNAFGWHKYLGSSGITVTQDDFGASAPSRVLFEEFGFTVDHVVAEAQRLL